MKRYFGRSALFALSVHAIAIALVVPVKAFAQRDEVPKPAVDLKPGTANYRVPN